MPKRRPEGPEPSLRGLGRDLRAEPSAGKAQGWTTLAMLRAQSLKAWESGELLRELLAPSLASSGLDTAGLDTRSVYPRRRTLKRPTAATLRTDYAAAHAWASELFAAAGPFSLETADVGRTTIGSNRLPAAAVFAAVEDEISFVGKTRDAARFRDLADALAALDPALTRWARKRPLQLLSLGAAALKAGRVALWLRDNPAPGIYVRQLSMPGVHTKFLETNRRVIDEMAAAVQPGVALKDVSTEDVPPDGLPEAQEVPDQPAEVLGTTAARTPAARFAERHGFIHPPELVRLRLLDPEIPLLGSARDITVTADAFSTFRLPVHTVIVTENLVNFLALPDRPGTVALFGAGYGFSALREAAWLRKCEVLYWGDLDTHGFRILDQLRAAHPHVVSVLMDQSTLLAHRDAWGTETASARAVLTRLTPEESMLYAALANGDFGPAVRLEQELIDWDWACERLLPGASGHGV